MNRLTHLTRVAVFITLFTSASAQALSPSFSYEGRVFNSADNTPLTSSSVTFKMKVKSADGTCLLYEEDQTLDLSATNGYFTIALNKVTPVAGSLPFVTSFSNSHLMTSTLGSCAYTPPAMDGRQLLITMSNNGGADEDLPPISIGSVPFAIDAAQVQGYDVASLLRVDGGTVPAFTAAQAAELVSLANLTDTSYMRANATSSILSPSATNLTLNGNNGSVMVTNTTASTSTTSGSLVVSGGVGVSGAVNASGNLTAGGSIISGGNVGIGTTSPSQLLDIAANATAAIGASVSNNNSISGAHAQYLAKNNVGSVALVGITSSNNNESSLYGADQAYLVTSGSGGLNIATANSNSNAVIRMMTGSGTPFERMRISSGGNVGIGTTNPLFSLDVSGTVNVASGGGYNIAGGGALRAPNGPTNIAAGANSQNSMSSGMSNAALGSYSLFSATTGSYNTALGTNAGASITTGSNNLLLGYGADVPTSSTSNFVNIQNAVFIGGASGSLAAPGGFVGIGTTAPASTLSVAGALSLQKPGTITASTYPVSPADSSLIFSGTGCTLTLPPASAFPGRILYLKSISTSAVTSASSNVAPVGSATAGTAILAVGGGKFAMLQSDGSNWIVMMSN